MRPKANCDWTRGPNVAVPVQTRVSSPGTSTIAKGLLLARAAGLALRDEDSSCRGSLLTSVCSACFILSLEVYFYTSLSIKELHDLLFSSLCVDIFFLALFLKPPYQMFIKCDCCDFFFFFFAVPVAYGSSWTRESITCYSCDLCYSCGSARSLTCCPHHRRTSDNCDSCIVTFVIICLNNLVVLRQSAIQPRSFFFPSNSYLSTYGIHEVKGLAATCF